MALKRVNAKEAKELMDNEGYALIDVRSMQEYADEHPAGAYNIPFLHKAPQGMVPNQEFADVIGETFPNKDAKVITTCAMGGRSVRAAQELKNLGYTEVVDLRGGFGGEKDEAGVVSFPGWKGHELPTERGDSGERAYTKLYKTGEETNADDDAPPAPSLPALPTTGWERFAHPTKTVQCIRLEKEAPALKRTPMGGPLGKKIKRSISAEAWNIWVEHSKMIINEYRLNPSDAKAQQLLLEQCNQFFFGEGVSLPAEYVPQGDKPAE